MTVLTLATLFSTALRQPACQLSRRPAVHSRTRPLLASAERNSPPTLREPDMLSPTEEGGVLSDVLPLSLLVESQSADRSGDLLVGEDAGVFAWKNEQWGSLIQDGGQVGRDWLTFFAAVGTIMTAVVVLCSGDTAPELCWTAISTSFRRPSLRHYRSGCRSSSGSVTKSTQNKLDLHGHYCNLCPPRALRCIAAQLRFLPFGSIHRPPSAS